MDVVRFLLDRGANVHATDVEGKTSLMYTCQTGIVDVMRLLLATDVDIKARDHSQRTALHIAVYNNAMDGARELIEEHDADMFAVDKNGDTPFDYAVHEGEDEIADCLLHLYGYNATRDYGRLALHSILRSAEYQFHAPLIAPLIISPLGTLTVQHLRTLLHSLDMDVICNRDDSGKLPIHIACEANAPVEVLTLLVKMDPATLQIADHTGSLPIHLLLFDNGTPTESAGVRYLVKKGGVGTLAARNLDGSLPLHNLVASTNPDCDASSI